MMGGWERGKERERESAKESGKEKEKETEKEKERGGGCAHLEDGKEEAHPTTGGGQKGNETERPPVGVCRDHNTEKRDLPINIVRFQLEPVLQLARRIAGDIWSGEIFEHSSFRLVQHVPVKDLHGAAMKIFRSSNIPCNAGECR